MELGAFSVSLAVKDLEVSRASYEKLGFRVTGGDPAQGWSGPFEPAPEAFTDVREIARRLQEAGIEPTARSLPESGGPGHIVVVDRDGNPVLIDQHR
jgi:catechol 2,3-dioxygenase-like lactoylglutathione lyase family enzyme